MNRFRRLLPDRERLLGNRWLRWLGPLLNHSRLWHWSRRGVALGVAIGIFFGLLIPVAQIPFSATAAVLLRANLPAAAASTLVTNPVTFAPIYYAAYRLGAWVTGKNADTPDAKHIPPVDAEASVWERIAGIGLPLIVGLAITATFAGLISYALISIRLVLVRHAQTASQKTITGALMKLFSSLYRRAMEWSRHPHAPWYLGGLSFAESSFFPIPPDVMLAPMCLANPQRAWRLAMLTTLASVAGGLFGYTIGHFAIDALLPWLQESRYWPAYQTAVEWFGRWGFWAVFVAGFSPIPYKVFTIAAGALSMALLPFALASLVGRGARFFLVAGLMAWGGARMEALLHRYVERIGWAVVGLVAIGMLWFGNT